jgi:hypothetical protein
MNEQEVRALVREAIERHLGRPYPAARGEGQGASLTSRHDFIPSPLSPHPSSIILTVLPGSEIDDGMCVIEPSVRCNHCGFCQSYGH